MIDFGRNILFLIPHPDDEIVAATGYIKKAQRSGSKINALYLTTGCVAQDVLWPWKRRYYNNFVNRRRKEGEEVAARLNLTPLAWSPRPARSLWQNLSAIYREIAEAFTLNAIDQIWVPAFEGGNADHDVVNALSSLFRGRCSILEFAEYNYAKGHAQTHTFLHANGNEDVLKLSPPEQNLKKELLSIYQSEKVNLRYIQLQQECCRPLATYHYEKPPHPGTLWYERFQWVPFKHPGVDFTQGPEVARSLHEFLKQSAHST